MTARDREPAPAPDAPAGSGDGYRMIFELSPEAIVILDRRGRVLDVNERVYEWLGYSPAEFIGKSIMALPFLSTKSKAQAVGKLIQRMTGKKIPPYELEFLTVNGEKRIGLIQGAPITDADGKITGDLVMISDITERKRLEEALHHSEERYRGLVEATQEGMGIVDTEENILFVNQAWADIVGYSREELLGMNLGDLMPEADFAEAREATRKKKRESGGSTRYETKMRHKSGEIRIISASTSPIMEMDGKFTQVVGVIGDITEYKRAQEELSHKTLELKLKTAELEQARAEAEKLLRSILPDPVVDDLESKIATRPRIIERATVVFVDFVDFSTISRTTKHNQLLLRLTSYFNDFDRIVKRHGLEKLKTVGDGYIFIGGLFAEGDELEECADAALEIRQLVHDGGDWKVRIGIHTGPCIAGLIGGWRMIYDVWGDTVNVAARLQGGGEPNRINVSLAVFEELKGKYIFTPRGELEVRNVGVLPMYYLEAPS